MNGFIERLGKSEGIVDVGNAKGQGRMNMAICVMGFFLFI